MYIVVIILLGWICCRLMELLTADAINELFAAGMTVNQDFLFEVAALVVGMIAAFSIRISGQYVFGRLMGFSFRFLHIGKHVLVKTDGKYSICRYKRVKQPQLFMMHPEGATRMKWAVAIIGGAPANLIASAVFLLLGRVVGPVAEVMLVFCGLLCGLLAIGEAIPMTVRGDATAGKSVVNLFGNEQAVAIAERNNLVVELGMRGVRVKDMPEELFRGNDKIIDSASAAIWNAIYAQRLMDEGKYIEAKEIMREAVNSGSIQDWEVSAIVCDAIMCEAAGECDIEKICKMLNPEIRKYMKKNADLPHVLRTRYIQEIFINKDRAAAQKIRERFEKVAVDYLKPGVIESNREYMTVIDEKAEEQK